MEGNDKKPPTNTLYSVIDSLDEKIVDELKSIDKMKQENIQLLTDNLDIILNHIVIIKKVIKKYNLKYFHEIEPISIKSFKYKLKSKSDLKIYLLSYDDKKYSLLINDMDKHKGYNHDKLLTLLNKKIKEKPSFFIKLLIYTIIAFYISLFFKDDIKNLLTNKSVIITTCENSIKKNYSFDDLIFLKQKSLNTQQDNEISVLFKDKSSGRIITTIYYKNKSTCEVANTNSSHRY